MTTSKPTEAMRKLLQQPAAPYLQPVSENRHDKPRAISAIAMDIRKYWPKPYYGAVPYVHAMACLTTINDRYGQDSAKSIVNYFLANANTWRGDDARRIKAELKEMLIDAPTT